MSDHDTSSDHFYPKRSRTGLITVVVVLVLGAAVYFWNARERRAETAAAVAQRNAEELAQLAEEFRALEASWREALAAGRMDEARRALEQAVQKQREYVRRDSHASPPEFQRLQALESALDELAVTDDLRRVSELEHAAGEAREAGDWEGALEKMKSALTLLETVNRSQASGSQKDLPRESRLRLDVETLEAQPLHMRLTEMRARAQMAAEEHRWDDVQAAFAEVRALQARINREYPRTPYANSGAEAEMEVELETLRSGDLAREIRSQVERAIVSEKAGRMDAAAQAWAAAQQAQERLNARFPRSRHATSRVPEEWEENRQTALSAEALAKLYSIDEYTGTSLAKGDFDAARRAVHESAELAAQVWGTFPRSKRLDRGLRERIEYRAAHVETLATLHATLRDALRVLALAETSPEAGSARRLLSTEVSQELYTQIAGRNPSRVIAESGPVDSVNWSEAQTFCRKLGWLLGRPVRLPRAEDYRLAVKTPDAFVGLSDGVSEWLDALVEAREAGMLSGMKDGELIVKTAPKAERSRAVGFRFVVEEGR